MHGGASIRIDIITRLEDTFHFLVGKYIGRIFRLSLSNVLEINRYVCIISGGYKIKCKLPDAADTLHMAVPFGFIRLLFTPAIYQFFCQNGRIDILDAKGGRDYEKNSELPYEKKECVKCLCSCRWNNGNDG